MNPKLIAKLLAVVMLFLAALMIIPLIMSIHLGEEDATLGFAFSEFVTVLSAFLIFLYLRGEENRLMTIKDSYLFVTLAWITATFIGAIPYYLGVEELSFSKCFFESMSGFTTTGASTFENIDSIPRSLLFWRNMTSWIGGMGIVVLFVALLPALGVKGTAMVGAETVGPTNDKLTPQIQTTALALWLIYFSLTALLLLLLLLGGLDLYDATTLAFGTISGTGLSTHESSIAFHQSSYVEWVCTVFMLLTGTNFALFFKIFQKKYSRIFSDGEFRLYLKIILSFSLLIAINLFTNGIASLSDSVRYALFHVVSFISTTGYTAADYSSWPMFSQILLLALLVTGGCAGSTSGGIKLIRIKVLYLMGKNSILKGIHPSAVTNIKMGEANINERTSSSIAGFIGLYIITLFFSTLIVSLSGEDLMTCFMSSLATLGNTGIGIGEITNTAHFNLFNDALLWVFSFLMLAGRLELFTIYSIFTRRFWKA